jgi:hypothetical protein
LNHPLNPQIVNTTVISPMSPSAIDHSHSIAPNIAALLPGLGNQGNGVTYQDGASVLGPEWTTLPGEVEDSHLQEMAARNVMVEPMPCSGELRKNDRYLVRKLMSRALLIPGIGNYHTTKALPSSWVILQIYRFRALHICPHKAFRSIRQHRYTLGRVRTATPAHQEPSR